MLRRHKKNCSEGLEQFTLLPREWLQSKLVCWASDLPRKRQERFLWEFDYSWHQSLSTLKVFCCSTGGKQNQNRRKAPTKAEQMGDKEHDEWETEPKPAGPRHQALADKWKAIWFVPTKLTQAWTFCHKNRRVIEMFIDCRDHFPARFALPFSNCSFLAGRPMPPHFGTQPRAPLPRAPLALTSERARPRLWAPASAPRLRMWCGSWCDWSFVPSLAPSPPPATCCHVLLQSHAPRLGPKASELKR